MELLAAPSRIGMDWDDIRAPDCPLVIEPRGLPFPAAVLSGLMARPEFELRIEGAPDALAGQMDAMPEPLVRDATNLARRFARFMGVEQVRLRLERIDRDACRKVHADYTDLRLLCTYAGPGTDYAPPRCDEEDCPGCDNGDGGARLERMATGWIGLFKGRTFAPGHEPALHRSPPVAISGEKRLLLVIDTPLSPELAALSRSGLAPA